MIKKTGREIHKLRKAKLGLHELDKHMFAEKMAFLTTSKCQVPPLFQDFEDVVNEDSHTNSRSSTLKHNTLSKLDQVDSSEINSTSSSTCSTPTPHMKSSVQTLSESQSETEVDPNKQRFSYEIDPDIGVIV